MIRRKVLIIEGRDMKIGNIILKNTISKFLKQFFSYRENLENLELKGGN